MIIKTKKILTSALLIVFILVSVLSTAFSTTHIGHDYSEEHCTVCAQIEVVNTLLKLLALAGVAAITIATGVLRMSSLAPGRDIHILGFDLVSLKVRMNN